MGRVRSVLRPRGRGSWGVVAEAGLVQCCSGAGGSGMACNTAWASGSFGGLPRMPPTHCAPGPYCTPRPVGAWCVRGGRDAGWEPGGRGLCSSPGSGAGGEGEATVDRGGFVPETGGGAGLGPNKEPSVSGGCAPSLPEQSPSILGAQPLGTPHPAGADSHVPASLARLPCPRAVEPQAAAGRA